MIIIYVSTALFSLAQFVAGWGADVHPTIGYLAERYLLSETKNRIQDILAGEPRYHGSIGSAANWADQTRSHATEGWHFIDAEDNPPSSCSVNFNRDCPSSSGCVVAAIYNNSQILRGCLSNNDVSKPCSDALKYIVHFFGDITQPLHCSAASRGGNEIEVKFGSRRRNLHSCWDSYIADVLVDTLNPPTFPAWTDQLQSRIDSGYEFLTSPTDWVSCIDPDNIEKCAVGWAKESNAFTCSYVYANLDTNVDLSGEYAQGAIPIIETQVAKAGLRLAVFLNLIVTGQPGWGRQSDSAFRVQA